MLTPAPNGTMLKPIVLCFSGADPCGGAGTQADIESISSMGGHAITVTTALTVQNSRGVERYQTLDTDYLYAQAQALIQDMPLNAVKTGMLGGKSSVDCVANILQTLPNLPLVVDPVMAANSGAKLSDAGYASYLCQRLLPLATIITPNLPELYQLAPAAKTLAEACQILSENGCQYILVTGAHDPAGESASQPGRSSNTVINRLFEYGELIDERPWPRLPGEYHGSGCTLAASLAAQLAKGQNIVTASTNAQDYTWHSLNAGQRLGQGQFHPDRFFWAAPGWQHD